MKKTDAQKAAQKRYIAKTRPMNFGIQYSLSEKSEGERLKSYLQTIGMTPTAYIKALIKKDLDSKSVPYPTVLPGGIIGITDKKPD